ncbi:hypothetical protein [Salinibacterium sp. ZJ70]|uniref:hypothetical protein n=1 Tax=Salinibacterium sp. ZJ70 TaxID=2708084 RepID=UPI001423D701|nr:hypothetical protein [Salinibacterium sp. ZJ70]
MTSNDSPLLPRSILVVEDVTYHEIARDPATVQLLEDVEAMVIPFAAEPELNTQAVLATRTLLREAGQLARGALLVRNPYQERAFEYADTAIESFASEKYLALANVARLLGATRVTYGEVRVEATDSTWIAGAKAKVAIGKLDNETRRRVEKKVERAIKGEHVFAGGAPDTDAALEYIRRRRLVTDQRLNLLVEMRSGHNLIHRFQMITNGLKESNTNFRAALELANAGPAKAIGAGGSFSHTASRLSSIEITIDIEFGEAAATTP